ncbi:hypothetical protein H5P35_13535 [Mycobacterium haemophilum DSM 44634]|nr:hypothetical protein [Mycobacterium haemophilum DSM 44634]
MTQDNNSIDCRFVASGTVGSQRISNDVSARYCCIAETV